MAQEMKDRVTRLQRQMQRQQEQMTKAFDKLSAMADDPNADPNQLADLEKAVQDHQANVDKIAAKIGG